MSTITSLGNVTKNTIYKSESHKLSEEFTVAAAQTLRQGQPVKLTATGEVTPWATADAEHLLIGFVNVPGGSKGNGANVEAAAGELVTIWSRGFMEIWCLSNAAVNCGPVTFSSYDSATDVNGTKGYNKVATAADAAGTIGWAIDQATGANQLIRVLVKN